MRASLAVGLAVSAYGISFGALATASGLDARLLALGVAAGLLALRAPFIVVVVAAAVVAALLRLLGWMG